MGSFEPPVRLRYEYFRNGEGAPRAVAKMQGPGPTWVLTQPVSTVIIGCDDIAQLEENVALAAEFQPLNDGQMARISSLTTDYAKEAMWYKRGARETQGDWDEDAH